MQQLKQKLIIGISQDKNNRYYVERVCGVTTAKNFKSQILELKQYLDGGY